MPSKLKPIPELDNLPDDKRDLLHQWIEELGYHKAIAGHSKKDLRSSDDRCS